MNVGDLILKCMAFIAERMEDEGDLSQWLEDELGLDGDAVAKMPKAEAFASGMVAAYVLLNEQGRIKDKEPV